jgi:two-component system NtrC family sensor kinase
MSFQVNLRWRVLALVAGGMALILILSAYLHQIITRALIEEVRYNAAISHTVATAEHVSALRLFSDPAALERELRLVAEAQPDFVQVDVYKLDVRQAPVLSVSTAPNAARITPLDSGTPDNALGEMERPMPGVVTMEVMSHGVRHWIISVAIDEHGGYVTALVRKNLDSPGIGPVQLQHNLVLLGALAICVAFLYLVFEYAFRAPARNVVEAMIEARGGNFAARATVRRPDELGEIARGFNLMMEDLSGRDREREELLTRIRRFNDTLRAEVDQATADLRIANQALLESQQRLSRSERLAAMGQVAATIAHEIGTPLNSISGHVALLARRLPGDVDAQRRARIISHQLDSIVASVRGLLQRTHKAFIPYEPTDVNTVIDELLRLVAPTLDAKAIVTTRDLAPTLPPVIANRDSLQHALLNLVSNSVDAMPAGGRLTIASRLDAVAGMTEVVVQDTGPGIAPDAAEHVFEPLFTTKATGSGFGLAIARDIVTTCGGQIDIDLSTTVGARFVIRLPCEEVHGA